MDSKTAGNNLPDTVNNTRPNWLGARSFRTHLGDGGSLWSAIGMLLVSGCSSLEPEIRSIHAIELVGCSLNDVDRIELEALGPFAPTSLVFSEVWPNVATSLTNLPVETSAVRARGLNRRGELIALGLFDIKDAATFGPLFRLGTWCEPRTGAQFTAALDVQSHPEGWVLRQERSIGFIGVASFAYSNNPTLRRLRDHAGFAVVGDRLLYVGGESAGDIWADAETLTLNPTGPARSTTESDSSPLPAKLLALNGPRADVSVVAVDANTALMVGGRTSRQALATLEQLELTAESSTPVGSLRNPRIAPLVARHLLGFVVAGGADFRGSSVPDLELLDRTGRPLRSLTFPMEVRDLIATESGAVMVLARDSRLAKIYMVRGDFTLDRQSIEVGYEARLIPGAAGRPLVVETEPAAIRRIDFSAGVLQPTGLPSPVRTEQWLGRTDGMVAVLRPDSALPRSAVRMFGTRYTATGPLLSVGTLGLDTFEQLIADRRDGISLTRAGLTLQSGARVGVADARFGDFELRFGALGRDAPHVELRGAYGEIVAEVGSPSCPWPLTGELLAVRDGDFITVGGKQCPAPTGLVSLVLVGGSGGSRVTGGFSVHRR